MQLRDWSHVAASGCRSIQRDPQQRFGSGNTTGVEVFNGTSFTGCPARPPGATNVNVTLTATPELQLNYSCTTSVIDSSNTVSRMTSGLVSLQVLVVCPSPPSFQLSPIAFNDSDNGTIVCGSLNGRPAAALSLTVSAGGRPTEIAVNRSNSTALVLPSPLSDWHGALVTCRVINNNCANMSITRGVMINHVNVTGNPDVVYTGESNCTLNCSSYVIGYPGVLYSWAVPLGVKVAVQSGPQFQILQGQSGFFNCTATNIVTGKSVLVVFHLSSAVAPTTPIAAQTSSNLLWLIGLFAGILIIAVITVFIYILYKRGHFPKGAASNFSKHHSSKNEDRDDTERSVVASVTQPSIDREYNSLNTQKTDEPNYAQLVLEEQNSNSTTVYENFVSSKRHIYPG